MHYVTTTIAEIEYTRFNQFKPAGHHEQQHPQHILDGASERNRPVEDSLLWVGIPRSELILIVDGNHTTRNS